MFSHTNYNMGNAKNLISTRLINYSSILFFFILVLIISQNLRYQYFWFDEAVQFWIGKGLNPVGPPLLKMGSINDVIYYNKYYNMDPGGFGLLVYLWSFFSNHVIWLRLLPFIFYLFMLFSFMLITYKKFKNLFLSIIVGSVPIFFPIILNIASEFRAYSMEALGSVICIMSIENLRSNLNGRNIFLWSILLSFFLTSRYSIFIVVFCISLILVYILFVSNKSLKQKIVYLFIWVLPLFFTFLLIYYFSLAFQNPNIESLPYLKYLSTDINFLFQNKNLLFFILLLFLTLIWVFSFILNFLKDFRYIFLLTILVNSIFILLSIFGKHPWDPLSHRCISMIILMVLSYSLIFAGAVSFLYTDFNKKYISSTLIFLFLFLIIFNKNNFKSHYGHTISIDFSKINFQIYKKIYVDVWETPYVKYLFEYGKYQGQKEILYPNQFTLKITQEHFTSSGLNKYSNDWKSALPRMNSLMNYDLLITPLLYTLGDNSKWSKMETTSDFWIKTKPNK